MPEDTGTYELEPDDPAPVRRVAGPPPPRVDAPAIPCPKCKYNLRGARSGRCPECGTPIRTSGTGFITSGQGVRLWADVYREPVLWMIFGLALGLTIYGVQFGVFGLVVFGVLGTVNLVVGWLVFLVLSYTWIGVNQPLHTVAVQLAGAYIGASGIAAALNLIPIPYIPFLIGVAVLVGLLSKLLDIEWSEAAVVAIIVWGLKALAAIFIVAAMMQ